MIATANTFGYAAAAGVVATLAALPIALLSVRFTRRRVMALERINMLVLAVPGLVIALSFTYVTEHFLRVASTRPAPLLVLAYAIMFFPLAVVSVRAAVARSPVGLEEVGRSLGVSRRSVLWRVTLPLIGPGLGRGVRARLLGDGHRADGDAGAPSHQRRDPGHPVLGLRVESLLQPGRAVCRRHGAHRRRARLRARAAGSTASPQRAGPSPARPPSGAGQAWCRHEGPPHQRRDQVVRHRSASCAAST